MGGGKKLRLPVVTFHSSGQPRVSVASPTTSPMLVFFGFGIMFLVFNFMLAFVGLVFSVACFFVFVFGFVLVAFCDSVPSTDYNSALSTSITI
jgi:hypothetical protein